MTWAPDYTDLDAFRAYLKLEVDPDPEDADDAAVYTPAITAASRAIDNACGRQFGTADETRLYTAAWMPERSRWVVSIDDLGDLSDEVIEVGGTVVDAADCTFLPLNAVANGKPYTYLVLPSGVGSATEGDVSVTSENWGWTAIPAAIVNATHLQAARLAKRRDAPFGVAGSPEMGNELRLLARLDPDVELLVRAYRRYW